MVNFSTWIPDCGSHDPALLDLIIFSDVNICSTMIFPPLGNSDPVSVSVSSVFPTNSKQDPCFTVQLMTTLILSGTVFVII